MTKQCKYAGRFGPEGKFWCERIWATVSPLRCGHCPDYQPRAKVHIRQAEPAEYGPVDEDLRGKTTMNRNELREVVLELLNFQIGCLRNHLAVAYLPYETKESATKLLIKYELAKGCLDEYLPYEQDDDE